MVDGAVKTEPDHFAISANFDGLVELLAKNLYPEPDAFVRELVQNGHDGICRRRSLEPGFTGSITIDVDEAARTITFHDDGLGMDAQDIREFLSVIGSSGTGTTRERLESSDPATAQALIGQFGIGALSAFVVADSVCVRTRKVGVATGWMWENHGSAECTLTPVEMGAPGTSVEVRVSKRFARMLSTDWVRRAVLRYCDLIPVRIRVGNADPVNAMDAPWHLPSWADPVARERACRAWLARRWPDHVIEIIPVELDGPVRARGFLHIGDGRVPNVNAAGVLDLYVRRMFVRSDDTGILPSWARFIRGVVDCPDLTPTAARDNVKRDEACKALGAELGRLIIERLRHLALHEVARFEQLARWHHHHITEMVACNEDLIDAMQELLLFETNRGLLALRDCVRPASSVPGAPARLLHYVPAGEDARPFHPLADAAGMVVVAMGHASEEALLQRYAQSQPVGLRLVRLDASADCALFRPPSAEAAERCRGVESAMAAVLRNLAGIRVEVAIRRFEPHELSSLLLVDAAARAEARIEGILEERWFAASLEEISREVLARRRRPPLRLVLNEFHPLVRRILDERGRRDSLDDVYCGLFLAASLRSRQPLAKRLVDAFQPCLDRLIAGALDQRAIAPAPGPPEPIATVGHTSHVH